jgi:hypothetical protein
MREREEKGGRRGAREDEFSKAGRKGVIRVLTVFMNRILSLFISHQTSNLTSGTV